LPISDINLKQHHLFSIARLASTHLRRPTEWTAASAMASLTEILFKGNRPLTDNPPVDSHQTDKGCSMELFDAGFDPSTVFVSVAQQQRQLESISNAALNSGITHFQNARYKEAAADFARAVALSPASPHAVTSAEYQANAYIKLGRVDKAVRAYETAAGLDPQSDTSLVKLGNLFYTEERYKEAETAYQKAVAINPNATNRYSLGQAYLQTGNTIGAEREFGEVARLIPDEPNGYFGLGLTYAKQERYDKAVGLFERAIEKDPEFFSTYLELGITLADAGRIDDAIEQFNLLLERVDALADQLSRYIYKVDKPKLMFANAASSLTYTLPMRTQLSVLDAYLETAGAAKDFTMMFQFDKQMSRDSVENVYNWAIGRADGSEPGNRYNFGLPVDDTEAALPSFPTHVA
jgi:tetratricopeptide (TPR) repeat protein